jgi:hypothetical protein
MSEYETKSKIDYLLQSEPDDGIGETYQQHQHNVSFYHTVGLEVE